MWQSVIPCEPFTIYFIFALSLFIFCFLHRQYGDLLARMHKHGADDGCQPTQGIHPQRPFHFGLDLVYENGRRVKEHRLAEGIHENFKRYGNTHWAKIVHTPVISTNEPENIKAFATTNFEDYRIMPQRIILVTHIFGGIFGHDGEAWQHSRALLKPLARMHNHAMDVYETHSTRLIEAVRSHGNRPFDLRALALLFTMDTITELVLGDSTDSLPGPEHGKDPNRLKFASDFTRMEKMAQTLTFWGKRIKYVTRLIYGSEYDAVTKDAHSYVDTIVKAAISRGQEKMTSQSTGKDNFVLSKPKKFVLVDELAKSTANPTLIRHEIMSVILAGHDSSATLLAELFYLLARHPSAWNKLQAEITTTLEGRSPTLDDLKRMPYLRATMDETLRLRPIIAVSAREAKRDTVLPRGGGVDGAAPIFVPRGAYVLYSSYALHRRRDIWGQDADSFRPERWLEEGSSAEDKEKGRRHPWSFFPFLGGPRLCLGQNLALSEVGYVTVRLCQAFVGVEAADVRPWEEALSFSFFNRHGCWVRILA